ncbi:SGNH/GDSL hydrolase family protein [Heyndrickxia sporothermodurans]|uniref:SGNH/GDSL hydrolase family protein n=1 Tax=Heyndrickxia sporothermodurans TaxID=46224 RepID=UPI002DB70819|nr:SGNH/GDSL hydrolase family protein [Heyndrickxia sporothermodurans]MEB6547767.1 SGNH/GDSL hydrolase family protein [Heyndrickxia sporothermodurans]
MKKILTLLLGILLFCSGCTFGIKEHTMKDLNVTNKPVPKDLTIISVGDSLTQGIGDSTNKGGYIPYLAKDLETMRMIKKVNFQNFGVRGNRTDQLLKRLQQKELGASISKADLVIITIGGNDIMKVFKDNFSELEMSKFNQALIGYKQRLNNIIKTIRKKNPHAGIVLIGLYNPFIKWFSDIKEVDEIIYEWNNTSKQLINNYKKTIFVPVADIFANQEENLLYSDNFHPNDHGYELIAKRIYSFLNNERKLKNLIE